MLTRISFTVLIISIILSISGCTGLIRFETEHTHLELIPGENCFELTRGVKISFSNVQKEVSIPYEIERISERTLLVLFREGTASAPGPIFHLSHEALGIEADQVLIVQPILNQTSYVPTEERYEAQFIKDSLSTVVRFTKLPYCLLISRADALYTAQHLPGKFLLEGDLLYHIGPNWIPSHSAVYLGVDYETAMTDEKLGFNNEVTFGESYPFLSHGYNLVEEGVFIFPNDIENHSYVNLFNYDTYESRWLRYWATSFSGARRFPGEISPQDRRKISRFMYETAEKGALWSVGFAWSGFWDLPFTDRDLYSCVGVVEKAYESAGRNIVPFWEDMFYLNSFEQFSRTIPVPEITSMVGDKVEFRINSLVAEWTYVGFDKWSFGDHAWIWKSKSNVELLSPQGSLEVKNDHCIFTWTPLETGDYPIIFRFFGEFEGKEVEKYHTLTVHVTGKDT